MAKKIPARRAFHVVATGFTSADFIALGKGPVYVQSHFTEADISWHDTLEEAMLHPAARDGYGAINKAKNLKAIDGQHEVQKLRVHARKATEAERVLFDGVTDPMRVPFLAANCEARADGLTLKEVAQEVWDQMMREVDAETSRSEARRQYRSGKSSFIS